MATSTHTHEELATKKDVDARFDRIDGTLVHLTSSLASILNVLTSLNERVTALEQRVTALEENQKTMLQMLERIEASTNRQIGF